MTMASNPGPSREGLRMFIAGALLPCVLVAGIWLGGHSGHLPSFIREALVSDHETQVVQEAIDRVARDYYRPIAKGQLANASIAGVVASLGDRFSHYLTPAEFRAFNAPPAFTGIGVSVDPDPTRLGLRIAKVFNASPA